MTISPVGARILIKVPESEKVSEGGIIIPQDERHKVGTESGVVIEIGSLAFSPPIGDGTVPIKVGDTVLIKRYAGIEILRRDNRYRLINDDDVIGIERE